MKKTLTALCFALSASFAFAQVNKMDRAADKAQQPMRIEAGTEMSQAEYKGSIFTKAEGSTLAQNTFMNAPTCGTLSASDVVNGNAIGTTEAHTMSGSAGFTWARIADTSASTFNTMRNNYPAFTTYWGGDHYSFKSETPNNGFMMMSMLEQYEGLGGTGVTDGGFNAYFQVGPYNVSDAPLVDVRFFQRYRKFNFDHCWIDYSIDGTTWNATEINVRGVDLDVNQSSYGWVRVTLPTTCAQQAALSIRVRWSAANDAASRVGTAGYFWTVDDLKLIEGPASRLTMLATEFYEGFYHLMPQGLQVPMVWNAAFRSTGGTNQHNVQGHIYGISGNRQAAATELATTPALAEAGLLQDTNVLLDPLGWWAANGFGYVTDDPSANPATGSVHYLPTTQTGAHYFFGDLTSNEWDHMYKITAEDGSVSWMTTDTMRYDVMPIDATNSWAVWGHDNGILTRQNYWLYGMSGQNVFSSDKEDLEGWHQAGYRVLNSYVTGETVPENWVIRGIQLVASTDPEVAMAGAIIGTEVRKDSVITTEGGMSVYFNSVETGSSEYTITDADLNQDEDFEVATMGNYNVINIEFPAQPALQPKSSYRIGYVIAEDNNFFGVAGSTVGYVGLDDQVVYFRDAAGYEDYASNVGVANAYRTLILDPMYPTNESYWHWFQWSNAPQIRMLVGPKVQKEMTNVSFECGEGGSIQNRQYIDVCGETEEVVVGSAMTYIFMPDDEDLVVDQIFLNDEVVFTNDTTDNFENYYVGEISNRFDFDENVNYTIRATFTRKVGINAVNANVNMNLQPNPATNNVVLNIEGVEGMVDFALIDMSGRVVRSNKINAEQAQNINLNGLAKGAYFVRITNSNMTKVEKLIVR